MSVNFFLIISFNLILNKLIFLNKLQIIIILLKQIIRKCFIFMS